MNEKIILDTLTKDGVNIIKQKYTTIDKVDYNIGKQWAKGYTNSIVGRSELQAEVVEPCLNVILTMWGDTPTVTESTIV